MAKRKWLLPEIEQRLRELANLPPDWDSYGASPPCQLALEKTRELLTQLYSDFPHLPLPFIAPDPEGGLGLEWGSEVYISISSLGQITRQYGKGGKMNKNAEDNKLENMENWDWEHAEMRPPVPMGRVGVSFSLSREDFELIAECAERLDKPIIQFILETVMDKVSGGPRVNITSTGG